MLETFKRYGFKNPSTNFVQNMFCYVLNFEGLFLYGTYLAIVKKSISLSDFAVLASGVVSGSWMIINLSMAIVELMKNGTYINNLRTFLETESEIRDRDGAGDLPEILNRLNSAT